MADYELDEHGALLANKTIWENEVTFWKVFHAVADEYGGPGFGESVLEEKRTDRIVGPLLSAMRYILHDETYWRGASALFLSTTSDWGNLIFDEHTAFIEWAGSHSDIKTVIATALERGTHDEETLRFLLDESNSHSAIKKGTL